MVVLSPHDQFDDSDACTKEIYDLGDRVAAVVAADIARAFVDLNRAPDDRPPQNPDGVVKSTTCFGVPVYRAHDGIPRALADDLLAAYYHHYHETLRSLSTRSEIVLGLDCHSMLAVAPTIAPDRDAPRPLFCLGNDHDRACSRDLLKRLAASIADAFEIALGEIGLNVPFAGGYITRTYGGDPIPWIQVEMNRSWYLREPWFDRSTLTVAPERLADLQDRFKNALTALEL
jgi:formiminoglutamase